MTEQSDFEHPEPITSPDTPEQRAADEIANQGGGHPPPNSSRYFYEAAAARLPEKPEDAISALR